MDSRRQVGALVSSSKTHIYNVANILVEAMLGTLVDRVSGQFIDVLKQYLNDAQIENLLSEKLLEEMHISEEHINFVFEELDDLLSKYPITQKIALKCNYDETKLGEYLWELYVSDRNDLGQCVYLECESELKKGFCIYAGRWIQFVCKNNESWFEILRNTNGLVAETSKMLKDMRGELHGYCRDGKSFAENIEVRIDAIGTKIINEVSGVLSINNQEDVDEQKEIEGFYCISQDFIDEISSSGQSIESKMQYYRLSGTIKDILDVVCQGQIVEYDELVESIISGINKEIVIGNEESIPTRVFFVTGEGGMGKTTFLVMAALKMARNIATNVYMMQIKAKETKERIEKIIERIDRKEGGLLFVDNPYDDLDVTCRLLRYVNENRNIHIVISERLNRLELIFKNSDLAFISNIAGAMIIVNDKQEYEGKKEKDIRFIRSENTHYFCLDELWKREVIEKMILYVLPKNVSSEDGILQNVLKRANYRVAICEGFLRICMRYNQIVRNDSIEVNNISFKFDWTEWENLFASDNGFESTAGYLGIQKVFPFIAALGLYKIPVTIEFISRLIGVSIFALKDCFDIKLRKTEPVRYDGETLTLKHDIIADLFFLTNKGQKPQFYLKGSVKYLDEFMAIPFERYVLSTKIIRGVKHIPHDQINTVELLEEFEKRPELIEYLDKHGRLYSYQYAKLYAMIQSQNITEEGFQGECDKIFENTLSEKKIQFSAWVNCFTASMETNFFPPESFFQCVEYLDYRRVTECMSNFETYVKNRGYEIKHYRRIARKTFQVIMENNPEDIPSRLALAEIMIAQSAVEDAERILEEAKELHTEEQYKAYVAYASLCRERYRMIDRQIRKLQEWKKKNRRIHNEKAVDQKESDVSMSSETETNTERAETEKAKVRKEERKKSKLSVLFEKRAFYFKIADTYYRLAAETDKGKEDERTICALATFLSQSAKEEADNAAKAERMKTAEAYFLKALAIGGNDSSAYNGLAMMYGNSAKWNPVYSMENAERYFEKATQNCPDNFMVTRFIPWGNINYNMGRIDIAGQKYQLALQYKPDEIRAKKGLELIRKEEEEFELLLKEIPMQVTSFESLYIRKKPKTYSGNRKKCFKGKRGESQKEIRVLNKKLFQEKATQREIFSLIYRTLLEEELTLDNLGKCKLAMKLLSTEGGISIRKDFQYLRIAQRLQRRCEQLKAEPYLNQQEVRTCAYYALKHYKTVIG